jgi:hypothetical protein
MIEREFDPSTQLAAWHRAHGLEGAPRCHSLALPRGWLAAACGDRVLLDPAFERLPVRRRREVLAHEWGHVLQQRRGDPLRVDATALEAQADDVADALSTRDVLPVHLQGLLQARAGAAVAVAQPKVNIVSITRSRDAYLSYERCVEALDTFSRVSGRNTYWDSMTPQERLRAREILKDWCGRPRHPGIPRKSLNLQFQSIDELARALAGSIRSRNSQAYEIGLANAVLASGHVKLWLHVFCAGLRYLVTDTKVFEGRVTDVQGGASTAKAELKSESGRYSWYYAKKLRTSRDIWSALKNAHSFDVKKLAALAADASMVVRDWIDAEDYRGFDDRQSTDPLVRTFQDARRNHWGVNESHEWVKYAREKNFALGAGPSATTLNTVAVAHFLFRAAPTVFKPDFYGEVMESLAWGLFAFWNRIDDTALGNYRGTVHTYHEVMLVAADFGVPYRPDKYPDSIPPDVTWS